MDKWIDQWAVGLDTEYLGPPQEMKSEEIAAPKEGICITHDNGSSGREGRRNLTPLESISFLY